MKVRNAYYTICLTVILSKRTFKVCPNPVKEFFFLETSETRFTRQVTVFPLHGQISFNSALVTRSFSFILGINVSFLKLLFCIVL